MELRLLRGQTKIQLQQELGRGGEGSVFAVNGHADWVAKIYKDPPDTDKVSKLSAMTLSQSPALLRIAAWPIDLLQDQKRVVRGFVMPKLSARRDLHELYSPKSRFDAFPDADFRFLVHVASNIARAFAVVHAHEHVLGDINHGNLLVGADGTVALIDCDSFQVRANGRTYLCDVGVPLFTAPELQGKSFRGLHRTRNHDRFGLGILLFHLLFMGRHPFAGRYLGRGEMPIEKAIGELRFAYAPDRVARGMEQPPSTVSLSTMGSTLAQLFVAALTSPGSVSRPDPKNWVVALEELKGKLRTCGRASWHQYASEASQCPWCAIESATGVRLFGQRVICSPHGAVSDLNSLWQAIMGVPDPGEGPVITENPTVGLSKPIPPLSIGLILQGLGSALVALLGLALLLAGVGPGIIAFFIAVAMWPGDFREPRVNAGDELASAERNWRVAVERWKRETSREPFVRKRAELETQRRELADLSQDRARQISALDRERKARQLERYLDRFRIDRASIAMIGASRKAMLASFGVETASDVTVTNIGRIPGFGPALTGELLSWRHGHERNFQYNPGEPIDPRDIAAVDSQIDARRQRLIVGLRSGPQALRQISQQIQQARIRLRPLIERARADYVAAFQRKG